MASTSKQNEMTHLILHSKKKPIEKMGKIDSNKLMKVADIMTIVPMILN